jgi:hypothetical protein
VLTNPSYPLLVYFSVTTGTVTTNNSLTGALLANWNAVLRRSVVVAGPESESEHDLGKSLFSASTSFFLLLGEGGRRSIVSHPLTWASRDMLDPDVLTTVCY